MRTASASVVCAEARKMPDAQIDPKLTLGRGGTTRAVEQYMRPRSRRRGGRRGGSRGRRRLSK
jgi:hypothetical protein